MKKFLGSHAAAAGHCSRKLEHVESPPRVRGENKTAIYQFPIIEYEMISRALELAAVMCVVKPSTSPKQ